MDDSAIEEQVNYLVDNKQYQRVIELLEGKDNRIDFLRSRRMAFALSHDFQNAALESRKLLKASDTIPDDWLRDGEIQYQVGEVDRAAESLVEAANNGVEDWRFFRMLGQVFLSYSMSSSGQSSALIERVLAATNSSLKPFPNEVIRKQATLGGPQALPFMNNFNGLHPAHMKYLEQSRHSSSLLQTSNFPDFSRLKGAVGHLLSDFSNYRRKLHNISDESIVSFVGRRLPCLMCSQKSMAQIDILASVPFTLGERPFVLFYDNLVALFSLDTNGYHFGLKSTDDLALLMKGLLEHENCRAIIPYSETGRREVSGLFNSKIVDQKIHILPTGVAAVKGSTMERPVEEVPRFLFLNSHFNQSDMFKMRRGPEILTAFKRIAKITTDFELVIRSQLPAIASDLIAQLKRSGVKVRVIDNWMEESELQSLLASCHYSFHLGHVPFHNGLMDAVGAGLTPILPVSKYQQEFVPDAILIKFDHNDYEFDEQKRQVTSSLTQTFSRMNPVEHEVQEIERAIVALLNGNQVKQRQKNIEGYSEVSQAAFDTLIEQCL